MACVILLDSSASVAYFFYVNLWKLNEGKMSGGDMSGSLLRIGDYGVCSPTFVLRTSTTGREVFPLWLLYHDFPFV
jgi:hypothetical protein